MTTISPHVPRGHRFAHLRNARRWLYALNDDKFDDLDRAVGLAAFMHPTGRVEAAKLAAEHRVDEAAIWRAVDHLIAHKFANLFADTDELFMIFANNRVEAAARRVARRNRTTLGSVLRAAHNAA